MTESALKIGYDFGRDAADGLVAELRSVKAAIDGIQGKTVTVEMGKRGMFERFTDDARRVVVLAQDQARFCGHHYIGTEHLTLALHAGPGVAAQALAATGVTAHGLAELVNHPAEAETEAPPVHIPFSARTKKVMELALREALMLGHTYIGTEHLLLALIREDTGRGITALKTLGVDPNALRQATLRRLSLQAPKPSGSLADRLDRIEEKLDAITRAFKSIGLQIPPSVDR